ncbi:hypothetical protein ABEX53_22990 [Bacillus toyonensis]|uniref:hypothetical protein n=1 Tax=Bacillus toyonensis TaxID=155322 RepID=UPI000CD8A8DD|nr:hypothetical protein [Bacillus toyonensis]MED3541700.1 hypothetical protein [Bacillus toyonensis]MEE2020018.1 hypothetical protein [Bacillus toyonensis]
MSKKGFYLKSKNDYIIYLRHLIISSFKSLSTYKKYLAQVDEIIEIKKLRDRPNSVISNDIYEESRAKLLFVANKLLNIYGDHSHFGMSYKKFREKAKKDKSISLILPKLDEETKTHLNNLNSMRNWGNHVPESLLVAQIETNPGLLVPPFNPFTIAMYEKCSAQWLISLYEDSLRSVELFQEVHAQMMLDYKELIEEFPLPLPIDPGVRTLDDLIIPTTSWNIQQSKK